MKDKQKTTRIKWYLYIFGWYKREWERDIERGIERAAAMNAETEEKKRRSDRI